MKKGRTQIPAQRPREAYRAFRGNTTGQERERWLAPPFLGVNGLEVGQDAVQRSLLASSHRDHTPERWFAPTAKESGRRNLIRVTSQSFPELGALAAQRKKLP
jgi:hypothetical protein